MSINTWLISQLIGKYLDQHLIDSCLIVGRVLTNSYESSIDGDVDQMVTKMLIEVSIDTWLALHLEYKIQIFYKLQV